MTIVKMPQLGESVTEGTIIQWFKQPGDPVKLDEPLCEIETEKVTAELPAEFEGTMGRILVPQGETVEVGVPLCEIDVAGVAATAPAVAASATSSARWSGGPMAIPPEEPPVVLPVAATVAVPRSERMTETDTARLTTSRPQAVASAAGRPRNRIQAGSAASPRAASRAQARASTAGFALARVAASSRSIRSSRSFAFMCPAPSSSRPAGP